MVRQSVEHGLKDLLWMDRMPLLDAMRDTDAFRALRAVVATRAQEVLDAWAGPPEPLPA